jgi:hypothetical protein
MQGDFLKNMKRNMKRRMRVSSTKPTGMSSTGIKKKLKIKGFGGMKFGKTKGY